MKENHAQDEIDAQDANRPPLGRTPAEIEADIRRVQASLASLQAEYKAARTAVSPIKPGDIVEFQNGSRYLITRLAFWSAGVDWFGRKLRKDGEFAKRTLYICGNKSETSVVGHVENPDG